MKLTAVLSSQINAIGHDSITNKMRIEFKSGALYEYSEVTPEIFGEFAKAKSIGSHFYKYIKPFPDAFPYAKLRDDKGVITDAGRAAGLETIFDKPAIADTGTIATNAVVHPTEAPNPPDPVPQPQETLG